MAVRRPLVVINGRVHELPVGDSVPGGAVSATGTPLRLLGFDAAGNLHEVSLGPGLVLTTGLLSLTNVAVDSGNLDGGAANSTYEPGTGIDGEDALMEQITGAYDGGDAGAVYGIDGGDAGGTPLSALDGGSATGTFTATYDGGGA
jgi:hypothetical protein